MNNTNIKISGFSLAKRKELTGDDFYDVQVLGNLTVAVVCDGVGSAKEGAEAAKRTTKYLLNNLAQRPKSWSIEKSIISFIKSINSILYQESEVNYERSELVTTLTIVVIEGNRLYGANVGDSRVYLYRDKTINQLSFDHAMDEAGYENVLTQAIGISKDVEPYYFENIIQKDDKVLLCSDGLYSLMSEDRLEQGIGLGAHSLVKRASKLTEDNLPDDTTAVVLEILQANELEKLKALNLSIPQTLKSGEVIDGYRLKKSLIQNNRTWVCEKDNEEFVIKFAPTECIDNEASLDLFVKEIWNAKRLLSDFFPKTNVPEERTQRYYIMELIDGDNLSTALLQKKLTIDDSIHLATMLLKMSQSLLKFDLVHGDIKPENIMLYKEQNENTVYKVVDFGSITEIFSLDTRAGTPSFLSPERFEGKSISESSEIFSIGVTLYYALTGKYPYGEIEPFQVPTFKEAKKPSKFNENIPQWLDSVIMRSIAVDVSKRYEHYSEMDYELKHPLKVKAFFSQDLSFIERSPVLFYRSVFTLSFIINIILIIYVSLQ